MDSIMKETKKVIVTGGFGFIGSNIIRELNQKGFTNITVVDDLKDGRKFFNLNNTLIRDFINFEDFESIKNLFESDNIYAVIHMGACSDTLEWDGNYMMRVNHTFTKNIFHLCQKNNTKFIYASSAATYGDGQFGYSDTNFNLAPLNVYGFSKLITDRYIFSEDINILPSVCVGLRFFNVFGPNEDHKMTMSSVVYHWYHQALNNHEINIFGAYDGVEGGEHMRDFIYVGDCAKIILKLIEKEELKGVFNLGTGEANSFNTVANLISGWFKSEKNIDVKINYIDFPEGLKKSYQTYTCADTTKLHAALGNFEFTPISVSVPKYLNKLDENI